MAFKRAFLCPECQALIQQSERGRTQGCEHYPPREWGWNTQPLGPRRSNGRQVTAEDRKALATRRGVEDAQERRAQRLAEREVWDEL